MSLDSFFLFYFHEIDYTNESKDFISCPKATRTDMGFAELWVQRICGTDLEGSSHVVEAQPWQQIKISRTKKPLLNQFCTWHDW